MLVSVFIRLGGIGGDAGDANRHGAVVGRSLIALPVRRTVDPGQPPRMPWFRARRKHSRSWPTTHRPTGKTSSQTLCSSLDACQLRRWLTSRRRCDRCVSGTRQADLRGPAPVPSRHGADPRHVGGIGRRRLDRPLRTQAVNADLNLTHFPAGQGRRAASWLASVPTRLGHPHALLRLLLVWQRQVSANADARARADTRLPGATREPKRLERGGRRVTEGSQTPGHTLDSPA